MEQLQPMHRLQNLWELRRLPTLLCRTVLLVTLALTNGAIAGSFCTTRIYVPRQVV